MFRNHVSSIGRGAAAILLTIASVTASAADPVPAYITAAVASPDRPAADTQRDADRKPAELLAFAGIKPGDRVSDLLPGGGYFTRLFSKVVGDKGVVYALAPALPANAPATARDPAGAVKAIAADPAFRNVRVAALDMDTNGVEPVDLIWTSLNYHDLNNRPNADMTAFNKSVFKALKPGGTFIVIDHAAETGSGTRDTSTLHRIDPAAVKTQVTSAGFVFDGESAVLHHTADPHTAAVRDSSVQGKTDQFAYRFRKPK